MPTFHDFWSGKMLSRSRSISRQFATRAWPVCSKSVRFISSPPSLRIADKRDVPVASYTEKSQSSTEDAHRTTLHVEKAPEPSTETKDVSRRAVPFDKGVLSKLSPTLKKFTLDNKVAVVTGYEIYYLLWCSISQTTTFFSSHHAYDSSATQKYMHPFPQSKIS